MNNLYAALGYLAVPCILCFLFGILMFVVEMFTPGFGVAGGLGVCSFAAVIIMQFLANSVSSALIVTAILLVLLCAVILLFIRSFQKGALSKARIVNHDSVVTAKEEAIPESKLLLVGKTGTAITPLRPAGIVEVEGKRINAQTYGPFIDKGAVVTVAAVEGLSVFVK